MLPTLFTTKYGKIYEKSDSNRKPVIQKKFSLNYMIEKCGSDITLFARGFINLYFLNLSSSV